MKKKLWMILMTTMVLALSACNDNQTSSGTAGESDTDAAGAVAEGGEQAANDTAEAEESKTPIGFVTADCEWINPEYTDADHIILREEHEAAPWQWVLNLGKDGVKKLGLADGYFLQTVDEAADVKFKLLQYNRALEPGFELETAEFKADIYVKEGTHELQSGEELLNPEDETCQIIARGNDKYFIVPSVSKYGVEVTFELKEVASQEHAVAAAEFLSENLELYQAVEMNDISDVTDVNGNTHDLTKYPVAIDLYADHFLQFHNFNILRSVQIEYVGGDSFKFKTGEGFGGASGQYELQGYRVSEKNPMDTAAIKMGETGGYTVYRDAANKWIYLEKDECILAFGVVTTGTDEEALAYVDRLINGIED